MVDQAEIHRKSTSDKVEDRIEAVNQLRTNLVILPDKDAAWRDLIRLTSDDSSSVRRMAADALGATFLHVPDKDTAWQDLHRLTGDEDRKVRWEVAIALGIALSQVPDKYNALEDLHRLTGDKDSYVRWAAAIALGVAISHVPNKDAAWHDLIRLSGDEDDDVRILAAVFLGDSFSEVSDRELAQQDLHRLIGSENHYVRWGAAVALGVAFSNVPNKETAYQDLISLFADEDDDVRHYAAVSLENVFPHVPDKDAAWLDLHRLSGDLESDVRSVAAYAIGSAFFHLPDKNAAWQDLHRLSGDLEGGVRSVAAYAIGSAFPYLPDKAAAWQDLHHLSGDLDRNVRLVTSNALSAVLSEVPDKDAAFKTMINLSKDLDSDVRVSANHSLGRASIFRATEAKGEEDFKRELENALKYFEKSATEAQDSNPAKFCLPFYRSFYVLTFKKEDSEAEVLRYLAEAKEASEGSKSKEDLLEAVENLSNALKETQSLRERGLEAAKCDLNSYRRYCDRAAELLDQTEESAPWATKIIKRGLPIINQRIKNLLEGIRDKSEEICKTGTPQEAELGCKIQKHAASALEKAYDELEVQKKVNHMLGDIDVWSDSIQDLHLRKYTKSKLEEAKNEDIIGQLSIIHILQVATMSGKNTPKYVIEDSTVQIAEGVGNDQKINVSPDPEVENSQNTSENAKDNRPWYKDRNYLIAVVGVLIAAMVFLVSIL